MTSVPFGDAHSGRRDVDVPLPDDSGWHTADGAMVEHEFVDRGDGCCGCGLDEDDEWHR